MSGHAGSDEPDPEFYDHSLRVSLQLDVAAAIALAQVVRRVRPEDYGADAQAWYRALDELSPQLPGTVDNPR